MEKNIPPHESAVKHVTGEAVYVDDLPVNDQLLIGRVVYSSQAHARITKLELTKARAIPGVHAVLSAKDIPGKNNMGPIIEDEPCLAEEEVFCVGQAIALIAAESEERCREAEQAIEIEYQPLESILQIEEAMARDFALAPAKKIERGNVDEALREAPHRLQGELRTGAQEHWYLESQVCLCLPGEGQEIYVYSSNQHPAEAQTLIAHLLDIAKNEVVVEVRRMGGGFGGKETQANHTACWTALLCWATRRPVKIRLFRDDDMKITGKRHPFWIKYEVGFDDEGHLLAVDFAQHSDAGCTMDLSLAILMRAMLHADNSYYIPHMRVVGRAWKTHHPSNTAFRGFGGPQGMAGIETVIDRVARYLKRDAAEIRRKNFYGLETNNVTHYGQTVENNRLFMIHDQLRRSSEYEKRRQSVAEFNAAHEFYKKGLAMTPVKFGISFTTSFLNQAGALVHVYQDGSVLIAHGGTEMGQGLHTKIRQIAAAEFGISIERVKVCATNTAKVPNTSATAASASTDLNGMAVKNAIEAIKERLAGMIMAYFGEQQPNFPSHQDDLIFANDQICDFRYPDRRISFAQAAAMALLRRVSLSNTGYYQTPGVYFDSDQGQGRPFYYYAFGMAVSEVLLDVLTGRHQLLRVDILHDVGESVNPEIDLGQVEGGYLQGVGWCTTEEIKWDDQGRLLTHSPDTYKIPSVRDIPRDFRTALLLGAPNPHTIRRSKAVGEPPLMLALSTWLAIKDAVSAVADHALEPDFSLPATHEVILLSIEKLKQRLRERVANE